ncbi:unnamed protein product [Anisakis simplex]|uniref:Ovule protein n=1 Tax=Anisakis simplex TaxID=6269 RepID=A0A0M3IY47_ANISI|nr:unnamed protein product [Anisakis simplex]
MIHVFNSPIDPSSMSEFQRPKKSGESLFKSDSNKRKITYTEDGRRVIDGKVEMEQKPNELWSVALTRSVVGDWKDKCDERLVERRWNFWEYRKNFF